ncbi:MAG TPA: hypothetical protein ENN19_07950 [Chloroflexi bacterium]|nr:hypothetical protein [Chloroflexota bacterium]
MLNRIEWNGNFDNLLITCINTSPTYPFTSLPIYQFTSLPIYQFTSLPIYQPGQPGAAGLFVHTPVRPIRSGPGRFGGGSGGPGPGRGWKGPSAGRRPRRYQSTRRRGANAG